jgi:hypothetical protein
MNERGLSIASAVVGGFCVAAVGVALVFGIALLDDILNEACHEHTTRIDCVLNPEHPDRAAAPIDD